MSEPKSYYSSLTFGQTTVTVIDEGTGWYRAEMIGEEGAPVDPFGSEHPDGLPIGFHVALIQSPESTVLVDAGFDDPDSAWGKRFASEWFVRRTPGLTAGPAGTGREPRIHHSHRHHARPFRSRRRSHLGGGTGR